MTSLGRAPALAPLLWVSLEAPDPHGGGGQRRQFHQLRALRDAGVDITLAVVASRQSTSRVSLIVPTIRFASVRRRLRRRPLFERVLTELRPRRAIVAHVESVAPLAAVLRDSGIPVLVDFHNVASRYYASLGDVAAERDWQEHERAALHLATKATACSEQEASALRSLVPSAEVAVAPHGVDPAEWPEDALAPTTECTIALFGSWLHGPNREAAEWLAQEVWPTVKRAVPAARLLLLGPGEPPSSTRVAGVEILGRVDDLARELGRARICVVPIRRGIGTRVKFVESLASGAAVVATTAGHEGFAADGAFVVADDAGAFADACIDLLRDPDRARALGASGRAVAFERYPWRRVSQPLLEFAR